MTLVQASLAAAHHNVAMESLRRQFACVTATLRAGQGERPSCLIMIDGSGRVDFAAGPLLPRVEARFGRLATGALAPPRLARMLAGSRISFRLVVDLGEDDVADVLSCPAAEDVGSLLVELREPADLRARFGLTAGEYRTLANIVRYETNERVAAAEGVSVPTIEKRMSAVLRKVRVETRVGAVREFLRAGGTGPADPAG
jgi:DNA-binding CsgD family transcriptional regulator